MNILFTYYNCLSLNTITIMMHIVEPIFIGKGIILMEGNTVIASNIGKGCDLKPEYCEHIRISCLYGIVSFKLILQQKNSSRMSSLHYNHNWYTIIKSIS